MVILPKVLSSSASSKTKHFNSYNGQFSDEDDDEKDEDLPAFPKFSKKLTESIEKLGESVFLKSDWHCPPKDAQ